MRTKKQNVMKRVAIALTFALGLFFANIGFAATHAPTDSESISHEVKLNEANSAIAPQAEEGVIIIITEDEIIIIIF